MFLYPASSSTARAGPPAMIPVPSGAFLINTDALPNLPLKSCGTLPFSSIGTSTRFFSAASFPLRIASGISVALPRPAPTCPFLSPTTTNAVNLILRPPLTTLVTRLIVTTLSSSSNWLGSIIVRFMSSPPNLRNSSLLLWLPQPKLLPCPDIQNRHGQILLC